VGTYTLDAAQPASMRERILDVALDLFIEHGYDGTSLREVAEQLGVTKAALYYHFEGRVTLVKWRVVLDDLLQEMLSQRPIFLLHERNQAALEKLHRADHDAEHEDLNERFHVILSDSTVPLRDRVKMAASFSAVFGTLFMFSNAFSEEDEDKTGKLLRSTIDDILGTRRPRPPGQQGRSQRQ